MILDTSAIIGLFELDDDRPYVIAAIRAAGGTERPAVLVVTLGELAAGVHAARDQQDHAAARSRTLGVVRGRHQQRRFDVLAIDEPTWRCFGEISGLLSRKLGHNDKWIAAAALATDRTLVTQDATLAEHAIRVPGLRVSHVARRSP